MLTGRYRSPEDIPADDVRKKNPQFQGDNFKINLEIVDKLVSPVVFPSLPPDSCASAYGKEGGKSS
jgi:hypothetical protein